MKIFVLAVLVVVSLNVVVSAQIDPSPIHYQIRAVPKPERTELEVTVDLKAPAGKPVTVRLPRDAYGLGDLHRFVTSFEGETGTKVSGGKDAAERIVQPDASGEIRLRYVLSYDPAKLADSTYAPNTGPRHIHVAGCQLFLQVGERDQKYRYGVAMITLPGWTMYSSLSADASRSEVTASLDDLATGTAFGGSASAPRRFAFHNRPVSIFLPDKFAIPAASINATVEKIVKMQRDFFRDYDQPFYHVVILPKADNVAGMRIPNLFVCFLKPDATPDQLSVLLSHEMAHNWMTSGVIKTKPGDTSLRYAWFYEGVNDYLARKLLLKAGILSPEQFADRVNRDIISIAENPHRAATYAGLIAAASEGRYDQVFNKLSYYRGGLIALNWDAQIRRAGKGQSIGDLIKRVYADAVERGGLTEEEFFAWTARFGVDGHGDFERYILRGEAITPAADALGSRYCLRETDVPSFETGYTAKNRKVVTVTPGGPAYRGGLREGMEIVNTENSNRWSYAWNPKGPYRMRVRAEGRERIITFLPRGKPLKLRLFGWR